MNALFLSSRWLDAATMTASSEQGTLVAANVLTLDPTQVWRATGCTAEWLAWDLGSAVLIDALIMNAHNLSADATIRLRLAALEGNVTALPDYDSGVVSPWPATGVPPADWLYRLSLLLASANETDYQFGRLDIADPTNAAGYVEIGRMFAGPGFVPALNVDINPTVAPVSSDEAGRTPYNHTIGDTRGKTSRALVVPMSAVNDDDMRDELFELQRYCGLARDFAFCLDPVATSNFHLYALQARFASLSAFERQPVWSDVSQLWRTTLNIEEIN